MDGPAVFRIRAGMSVGAGNAAAGKADFRAFKLRPAFWGKVECQKSLYDVQCGSWERCCGRWIIFAKLFQNVVLIGQVATMIYGFHNM